MHLLSKNRYDVADLYLKMSYNEQVSNKRGKFYSNKNYMYLNSCTLN